MIMIQHKVRNSGHFDSASVLELEQVLMLVASHICWPSSLLLSESGSKMEFLVSASVHPFSMASFTTPQEG